MLQFAKLMVLSAVVFASVQAFSMIPKEERLSTSRVHRIDGVKYQAHLQGFTLNGWAAYRNTCFKPHNQLAVLDLQNQEIRLYHTAKITATDCRQKNFEEKISFYLGPLPDGDYRIQDGLSRRPIGQVKVEEGLIYLPEIEMSEAVTQ